MKIIKTIKNGDIMYCIIIHENIRYHRMLNKDNGKWIVVDDFGFILGMPNNIPLLEQTYQRLTKLNNILNGNY
jgi:hypothetical protein